MTERFFSSEHPEFNEQAFRLGAKARAAGKSLSKDNPYSEDWSARSWRAGWADKDMQILSERRPAA